MHLQATDLAQSMLHLSHYLTDFLGTPYKYALFFLLVMLEGPLVMLLAGFLASLGQLGLALVYLLAVTADILADCCYYALGYWGSKPAARRWLARVGISPEHAESLESQFDRRGGKLLVIGKLSHGIGAVFLVAAGFAKMPFRRFFLYDALATLPKTLLLVGLGYYFGRSITQINSVFNVIAASVLGVGICVVTYLAFNSSKESADQ